MRKILIFSIFLIANYNVAAQTINFQYFESRIFIEVKVNGVNLLFLLNTGANKTVIDQRIAEQMKLPILREIDTVTGTAGKQEIKLVKINTLEIGKNQLKDLEISSRNIGKFTRLRNHQVDGIIGADVLKNYAITIDYSTKKIAFQSTKIPSGRKKIISFDMSEGIPRFEVRLNDTMNTFLHLNTGVSIAPTSEVFVNIAPKQWFLLKSITPSLTGSKYLTGTGVGGNVYLEAVKVNCIELNEQMRIFNGYVIIQPSEGYFSSENAIGFFGNNLLEKYRRVSVDFLSRKIILPATYEKRR